MIYHTTSLTSTTQLDTAHGNDHHTIYPTDGWRVRSMLRDGADQANAVLRRKSGSGLAPRHWARGRARGPAPWAAHRPDNQEGDVERWEGQRLARRAAVRGFVDHARSAAARRARRLLEHVVDPAQLLAARGCPAGHLRVVTDAGAPVCGRSIRHVADSLATWQCLRAVRLRFGAGGRACTN